MPLSARLILGASGMIIAVSAAALSSAYLTLSSSLRDRDRSEIRAQLDDLSGAYSQGGLAALRADLAQGSPEDAAFLVRLDQPGSRGPFESLPPRAGDFDLARLRGRTPPGSWIVLPGRGGEESLEVLSLRLKDGALLQVGRSDASRQDVLERFRWIAASLFFPAVGLSLVLGWLLASRALSPIRHLREALESVSAGKSGSRVPAGPGADELERLGVLFNRMLERIEALLSAMKGSLDAVAHDLRTPITRLRARAEDALASNADFPECRRALADCVEEADRVAGMLTTLMDISEAESGALSLKLESVDLLELARETAELYGCVAEEKGVSLRCRGGPARAVCDRNRLRQALANLVDNAVKYTAAGGLVELETSTRDGEAVVAVRDSGAGIPPEDVPRVWDRLFRGEGARAQRGLGLGLSLVRAVVSAHGGRVEVSSASGKGSLFTLLLKEASAEPAALPLEAGRPRAITET